MMKSFKKLVSIIHVPDLLRKQLGWTTLGFAVSQAIRFAASLALTRILAPDLLGVMVLLTSIRVGIELFTDVGIGQNVISSARSYDERYYRTAWTLQIVRGAALAALFGVILPFIGRFYQNSQVDAALPALCAFFIISGSHSIGTTLAVKQLRTKRIAIYDTVSAICQSICSVLFVLISPSLNGLILGQIVGLIIASAMSYLILPQFKMGFCFDARSIKEIISFGKWIFVSSIVFFISGYADRLILAKLVSLSALGTYGIAKSLGDIVSQFAVRLSNAIIFPSVVNRAITGSGLRLRMLHKRRQLLACFSVVIVTLMVFAMPIVATLYDTRYSFASVLLPWVAFASWLTIINTLNESVLLGLSQPKSGAIASTARMIALVCILPVGISHWGVLGAAIGVVLAEVVRYVVLYIFVHKAGIGFIVDDIVATFAVVLIWISGGTIVSSLIE